jgi:predicted ATP-binding protein involved in virulence
MRIDRLRLLNFRGFSDATLELDPRLTVVAGVNGSGKSSLIEGLAVAAGAWFLGFGDLPQRRLRTEDVRHVPYEFEGQPSIEPQFPCRVEAEGVAGTATRWVREVRARGGYYGDALEIKAAGERAQRAVAAGEPVDLPVLAAYGAGRLWLQKRTSTLKEARLGSRTQGYTDCLEAESSQRLLIAWMRRMETARIQRIAAHGGPLPAEVFRPPALDLVQRAAAGLIEGAERLYFDVAHDELRLHFRDGRQMPFHLLSDGFRGLVALAADLAWRAIQLNPHQGAAALDKAVGIVLIDEIELHLHPAWQRSVLDRLLNIFPGLQFVVTTHAPLVLAATPAHQLRFLDATGAIHRVQVANGLTANTVLRALMGVPERADWAQRALSRLGALIEQGEKEAARAAFTHLRDTLGDLDPDLLTLEWELRDLEVHG